MRHHCFIIASKKKKYFGKCKLYRRMLTFYDEHRVYSIETMERIEQLTVKESTGKQERMMHFRLRKKKAWDTLGCLSLRFKIQERYAWKSFWLFFDAHLDQVEILTPTLDVIEDLKRDGLIYAVNQFKSMREFKIMDELRYHYCMASYRFATSYVGQGLFRDAFIAMMTNTPMPSKDEIQKEIDRKRFTFVETDEDVKKLDERKLWYQRMIEHQYDIALHVLNMFSELRVFNLMTMERASIKELDLSILAEDVEP